jgi:hypothetical protein
VEVRGDIFSLGVKLESELWQNPLDLKTFQPSFKTTNFYTEKRVGEP